MNAKITLVGAGPGDPELISLKGVRALTDADVVLYDALTHPDLLDYVSDKAVKIYVGKRRTRHAYPQEEINQMLVDYAFSHGHVVRLKGGDPMIFGRGHEELTHAESFGIPVEVIPGISSINLAGMYKTPLTKRGVNESFWVITGTTSSGAISNDISLAAQSTATVVILMGLNKLGQISKIFSEARKAALPVAVIEKGSLPSARTIFGTIEDIHERVLDADIKSPAIIILGESVSESPEWRERMVTVFSQPHQNGSKPSDE